MGVWDGGQEGCVVRARGAIGVVNVEQEREQWPRQAQEQEGNMGMKNSPWFQCILLEKYVVPLLHCLIGTGNNLFAKFHDIFSKEIKYISQ